MDFRKLFTMQDALDRHIESNHGLQKENLIEKKVLALLVELGELANETRCFKFWSLKQPSAQETILEEYVDGIHFILSLGIDTKFNERIADATKDHGSDTDHYCDLASQFLNVYACIDSFRRKLDRESYMEMFNEYLKLGKLLGFSADMVMEAYVSKNEVNFIRQENGY